MWSSSQNTANGGIKPHNFQHPAPTKDSMVTDPDSRFNTMVRDPQLKEDSHLKQTLSGLFKYPLRGQGNSHTNSDLATLQEKQASYETQKQGQVLAGNSKRTDSPLYEQEIEEDAGNELEDTVSHQ